VALLSIESDTDKGRMKISGEAKDLQAMLDYLRFLGTQPTLAEVYLQSHQVQQQDPQRPVRFVLSADWTARR
jgi:Fimbrial assembly protein (PilN)